MASLSFLQTFVEYKRTVLPQSSGRLLTRSRSHNLFRERLCARNQKDFRFYLPSNFRQETLLKHPDTYTMSQTNNTDKSTREAMPSFQPITLRSAMALNIRKRQEEHLARQANARENSINNHLSACLHSLPLLELPPRLSTDGATDMCAILNQALNFPPLDALENDEKEDPQ